MTHEPKVLKRPNAAHYKGKGAHCTLTPQSSETGGWSSSSIVCTICCVLVCNITIIKIAPSHKLCPTVANPRCSITIINQPVHTQPPLGLLLAVIYWIWTYKGKERNFSGDQTLLKTKKLICQAQLQYIFSCNQIYFALLSVLKHPCSCPTTTHRPKLS